MPLVRPFVRKSLVVPAFILTVIIYITFDSIGPGEFPQYPSPPPPDFPNHGVGSSFGESQPHWQNKAEKYPVESYIQLPTNKPGKIPKIQYDFPAKEAPIDRKRRLERQAAVQEAFTHAWGGYKSHAWLKDEVSPISGGFSNGFAGWAASLVDTLDTLLIMGMKDEFEEALNALEKIDFSTTSDQYINVFETTIRYMGGFMAAYDLSDGKYPILLKKAQEVGDLVYGAFDTPNRMQISRWDWKKSLRGDTILPARNTLLAEVGSLCLEFTRLTQLTGDPKYFDAIQRVTDELEKAQSNTAVPGLWPMLVDLENLIFSNKQFTLGGMADSTYEYLPKEHLLLGDRTKQYQRMYEDTVDPIKKHLLFRPMTKNGEDILFSGSYHGTTLDAEAQHLTCFVGGMFGLGGKAFDRPADLAIARKLVDGCIWAYDSMATGLMPEIFFTSVCDDLDYCPWDEKKWLSGVRMHNHVSETDDESVLEQAEKMGLPPGIIRVSDPKYILRPEAIESVFIMYRITGDKKLQDAAWRMFTSIEKMTRTEIAHASIEDVRFTDTHKTDKMESFWMAETLKYFYLIFSEPGLVSLDDYVLNTEAHPFRRPVA
ncbi:class I alpha-mannosidase [Talaromyces proteolyticus]|uniref:alpha-1,2-Mannosidase n=1 Tax=Talaromyces proteolyticus TaxID=1131652 RepID=A0AAD4L3W5_9EURO|nr:class I alpha-mannosidase [Talaromyces proteolyticus]KAH8704154.1 class I alpha-mannosidase [Talaromyces proteolyticus]